MLEASFLPTQKNELVISVVPQKSAKDPLSPKTLYRL